MDLDADTAALIAALRVYHARKGRAAVERLVSTLYEELALPSPARLCARCGKAVDNLQGMFIVAGVTGDVCHHCVTDVDAVKAVAKGI